jgi:hypothetical protein
VRPARTVDPRGLLEQYAFTKRACQAAALRDIADIADLADLADPLDRDLPDGMTSDEARHAHRRYWQQLKGAPAPWWSLGGWDGRDLPRPGAASPGATRAAPRPGGTVVDR